MKYYRIKSCYAQSWELKLEQLYHVLCQFKYTSKEFYKIPNNRVGTLRVKSRRKIVPQGSCRASFDNHMIAFTHWAINVKSIKI